MKKLFILAIFLSSLFNINLLANDTLKILTWKGFAPQALVEKFEKETGIDVQLTYTNNEEMIAKLRATRGAGFDLAQPSQDRVSSVQAKYHIYRPIDYSRVELSNVIPSMLEVVKKNTQVDGKSYGVPFCYGTSGLIVNKKLAPNVKDYSDLLNSKYKGKIAYRLKRPTLIGIAFSKGINPFEEYSDVKAYSKLMHLVGKDLINAKPFVHNYWTNGDALLSMLRSGEVSVAMGWNNIGWKLHKENPNIDFVMPKSGALGWIDIFAIPSKAENIDAAYKWINFMIRPENSAYFSSRKGYASTSKGAVKILETEDKDFDGAFTQADIKNIHWYPPVPSRLERIEGKILDLVKAAQ